MGNTNDNNKAGQIYDLISQDQSYKSSLPDRDTFISKMQDTSFAGKFFDLLSNDSIIKTSLPDRNTFVSAVSSSSTPTITIPDQSAQDKIPFNNQNQSAPTFGDTPTSNQQSTGDGQQLVQASKVLRQKQLDYVKTHLNDIWATGNSKEKEPSAYSALSQNPFIDDVKRDKIYDVIQKRGKYTDEEMAYIKGADQPTEVPLNQPQGGIPIQLGHVTVRQNPITQQQSEVKEPHEWLTNPFKAAVNDAVVEGFKGGWQQLKNTEKVYDTEGDWSAAATAAAGISKMVFSALMATPQGMAFTEGIGAAEETPLKKPIEFFMQPATHIANWANVHPESEGGKAALEVADFLGMAVGAKYVHGRASEIKSQLTIPGEHYESYQAKPITPENIAADMQKFAALPQEKQQELFDEYGKQKAAQVPETKPLPTEKETALAETDKKVDDITNQIADNPDLKEVLQPALNDAIIEHDKLQSEVAKSHIDDAVNNEELSDLIEKRAVAINAISTANETVKPILEKQIDDYNSKIEEIKGRTATAPKLPIEESAPSPTEEFSGEEVKAKREEEPILSKENLDQSVEDIKRGIGFKEFTNQMTSGYARIGDTMIRVKDHTPEWAYFRDDIDNGVKKIINVTVGDIDNRDNKISKTELSELQKEFPDVEFIDLKVNEGENINDVIEKIKSNIQTAHPEAAKEGITQNAQNNEKGSSKEADNEDTQNRIEQDQGQVSPKEVTPASEATTEPLAAGEAKAPVAEVGNEKISNDGKDVSHFNGIVETKLTSPSLGLVDLTEETRSLMRLMAHDYASETGKTSFPLSTQKLIKDIQERISELNKERKISQPEDAASISKEVRQLTKDQGWLKEHQVSVEISKPTEHPEIKTQASEIPNVAEKPSPEQSRQFAIDYIKAGLVEVNQPIEKHKMAMGKSTNAIITERLNLGLSNEEKLRGIKQVKEGQYDRAAAKKLIDKLSQMHQDDNFEFVQGLGGETTRISNRPTRADLELQIVERNLSEAEKEIASKIPQEVADNIAEHGITSIEDAEQLRHFPLSTEEVNDIINYLKSQQNEGKQKSVKGNGASKTVAKESTRTQAEQKAAIVEEAIKETGEEKEAEKIPAKYQERVALNMKQMGTDASEWTATPIIEFQETKSPKGDVIKMPVFEFPKGYKRANTLFPSDEGNPCCELCGKTPISKIFHLQNDAKKLTLSVGSECVRNFGEGQSGQEIARKTKIELAEKLSSNIIDLKNKLKEENSFISNVGYGKKERVWRNSEKRKFYESLKPFDQGKFGDYYKKDNFKTEEAAREAYERDILNWYSRNQKKFEDLFKEKESNQAEQTEVSKPIKPQKDAISEQKANALLRSEQAKGSEPKGVGEVNKLQEPTGESKPQEAGKEKEVETPLQKAKRLRDEAKAALKKSKENLGIVSDPEQRAKLLFDYHKATAEVMKEWIKEKGGELKDWLDEEGEKLTNFFQSAWDDATGKATIKTQEDLPYYPFEHDQPVKKRVATERAYEGTIREETKKYIEQNGLYRDKFSQEERSNQAKALIDKVGEDNAVEAVRNHDIRGAMASSVLAQTISRIDAQMAKLDATEVEKLDALAKKQADIIELMGQEGYLGGEYNSQLAYEYEHSDIGYNAVEQIKRWKDAFGDITPEEKKAIEERDAKLKEVSDKLNQAEERAQKAEQELALKEIELSEERKRTTQRNEKLFKEASRRIADKIREGKLTKPSMFQAATPGSIVWDATLEVAAKTIEATGDIAQAVADGLKYIKDTDWYKGLSNSDKKQAEQQFTDFIKSDDVKKVEGDKKIPKRIISELVREGLEGKNIEERLNDLVSKLQKQYPELTEREIRDEITGYGKTVGLSKKELSAETIQLEKEIRQLNRVGRTLSALEDVQNQKRPLRSGLQRDKLVAEERKLLRQLREQMKLLPTDEATKLEQLKTAADATKSRLQNKIEELQLAIDNKQKIEKVAKNVVDTPELTDLKNQLKEKQAEYDAIFKDEAYQQAKRLENAKKRAQQSINELRRRLRENDFSKVEKKTTIADNELTKLRAEKLRLKDEYDKEFYKKQLQERTRGQKIKDAIWDAWNVPRLLSATGEWSFVGVQGLNYTIKNLFTNPKAFAESMKTAYKFMANEKNAEDWLHNVRSQDWYNEVKGSKLALTEPQAELSAREELFFSGWADMAWQKFARISSLGNEHAYEKVLSFNPFRGLERGAVGYLDTIRLQRWLEGRDMLMQRGLTFEKDPQAYKDMADVINTLTGRASLDKLETISKPLTKAFFSPRNWASMIKTATPYGLYHFGKMRAGAEGFKPSVAQKMAFNDLSIAVGATTSFVLMAAAYLNNDDDKNTGVEFDPRSTDFMKIKIGDVRIDPFGGRIQQIIFLSRLMSGETKTSSGDVKELGIPSQTPTRAGIISQMMTNKLNPTASLLSEYLSTQTDAEGNRMTEYGKPYSFGESFTSKMYPIYYGTLRDLDKDAKDNNHTALNTMLAFYAFFGGGVNVYQNTNANKDKTYYELYQQYKGEYLIKAAADKSQEARKKIGIYNEKGEQQTVNGRLQTVEIKDENILKGYNDARKQAVTDYIRNNKDEDPEAFQKGITQAVNTASSNYLISNVPSLYDKEMAQRKESKGVTAVKIMPTDINPKTGKNILNELIVSTNGLMKAKETFRDAMQDPEKKKDAEGEVRGFQRELYLIQAAKKFNKPYYMK